MATKNPRISVTLKPESAAVLYRLAELSKQSVSSLVGDLLETTGPVFGRMVQALEAAQLLQSEAELAKSDIGRGLIRAQTRIEAQMGLCLDDLDEGIRPILEQAEKVERRGRGGMGGARTRRSQSASTPVPVTRGSGTPRSPERDGESHAKAPKGKGSKKEAKGVGNGRV